MRNGKKEMADTTDFRTKAQILSDLWTDFRDDENFADFISYNDLGLPLSYAIANGIIEPNAMVEQFVNEAYRLLIAGLEIDDKSYSSLDDMLDTAETK